MPFYLFRVKRFYDLMTLHIWSLLRSWVPAHKKVLARTIYSKSGIRLASFLIWLTICSPMYFAMRQGWLQLCCNSVYLASICRSSGILNDFNQMSERVGRFLTNRPSSCRSHSLRLAFFFSHLEPYQKLIVSYLS